MMRSTDPDLALQKSVTDVLEAKEQLRALAERVRTYPEAAQRLLEVCGALERTARGLNSASEAFAVQDKLMREAFAAQDKLMREAIQRLNETSKRMDAMGSSILGAIASVATGLEQQRPLLEKAAKRRLLF